MTATVKPILPCGATPREYSTFLRSSDGGLTVTQWGTANDFPVASYDTH